MRDTPRQRDAQDVDLPLADAKMRLQPALTEMTLSHRALGNRGLPLRGGQARQVSSHEAFLLPPVTEPCLRDAAFRRPVRLHGQSAAGPADYGLKEQGVTGNNK